MRNENTSSRYDSRKLRDPQRTTGKYIFSHIEVEYIFCSYSDYHKVHRGISVEAWYITTSNREKIPATSLFTPTLLVIECHHWSILVSLFLSVVSIIVFYYVVFLFFFAQSHRFGVGRVHSSILKLRSP